MNLSGIEDLLDIEVLFGDGETSIEGVSTIHSFLNKSVFFISSTKFLKYYLEKNSETIHGVVISKELLSNENQETNLLKKRCSWLATSENINACLVKASKFFHDQFYEGFDWTKNHLGNHKSGSENIQIANDVYIGPNVELRENVILMSGVRILGHNIIEANTVLFPNVTIYPNVKIGKNCRVHSNTTIGADGFGYKFLDGQHEKLWHYGGVEIQDNVEIGSNSCIDGGTFNPTVIGEGCKIDNHVQIAHNVILGRNVILCGKVGLAGSCKVGDFTVIGGGAGVAPDCELGVGCKVGGGAQVNKSWADGSSVVGYPATNSRDWKRSIIRFQQLNKSK